MSEPIEVRLAQVAELHQPQPIHGECWHAPDYGCTPVEVPWVDGCNQSIEGWYCPTCCTANDVSSTHPTLPTIHILQVLVAAE